MTVRACPTHMIPVREIPQPGRVFKEPRLRCPFGHYVALREFVTLDLADMLKVTRPDRSAASNYDGRQAYRKRLDESVRPPHGWSGPIGRDVRYAIPRPSRRVA